MDVIRASSPSDIWLNRASISEVFNSHGIISYPTDTVSGIGCSVYDPVAIDKLIEAKKRLPSKKGLPVLVSERSAAEKVATVNGNAQTLMERFWPGALTLVLPLNDARIDGRVSSDGSIGLRMPNSGIATSIASIFGGLIVGTSANISGEQPINEANEMKEKFPSLDLIVCSASRCPGGQSTVFDVSNLKTIREGAISTELIEKALDI